MARRDLTSAFVVTGLILAGAAALKFAWHGGLIDTDTETRLFGGGMGLVVAYYGNVVPKQLKPSRGAAADGRWQRVARVSGWSFTLAGLAYAALSLLKPFPSADLAAMACVGAAVAITLAYGLWCTMAGKPGQPAA